MRVVMDRLGSQYLLRATVGVVGSERHVAAYAFRAGLIDTCAYGGCRAEAPLLSAERVGRARAIWIDSAAR